MQWRCSTARRGVFRRFALGALAAGGIACVLALAAPAPADPEGGQEGPQQQRLSGSERSLVVLREIKDVLERIDSRLQRIEDKLARVGQGATASQANSDGTTENPRGGDR